MCRGTYTHRHTLVTATATRPSHGSVGAVQSCLARPTARSCAQQCARGISCCHLRTLKTRKVSRATSPCSLSRRHESAQHAVDGESGSAAAARRCAATHGCRSFGLVPAHKSYGELAKDHCALEYLFCHAPTVSCFSVRCTGINSEWSCYGKNVGCNGVHGVAHVSHCASDCGRLPHLHLARRIVRWSPARCGLSPCCHRLVVSDRDELVLVISSGSRVTVGYFAHRAMSADYSGMWRLGVGLDDFACQCFSSLSVLLGRQRVHRVAAFTHAILRAYSGFPCHHAGRASGL